MLSQRSHHRESRTTSSSRCHNVEFGVGPFHQLWLHGRALSQADVRLPVTGGAGCGGVGADRSEAADQKKAPRADEGEAARGSAGGCASIGGAQTHAVRSIGLRRSSCARTAVRRTNLL